MIRLRGNIVLGYVLVVCLGFAGGFFYFQKNNQYSINEECFGDDLSSLSLEAIVEKVDYYSLDDDVDFCTRAAFYGLPFMGLVSYYAKAIDVQIEKDRPYLPQDIPSSALNRYYSIRFSVIADLVDEEFKRTFNQIDGSLLKAFIAYKKEEIIAEVVRIGKEKAKFLEYEEDMENFMRKMM